MKVMKVDNLLVKVAYVTQEDCAPIGSSLFSFMNLTSAYRDLNLETIITD